MYLYCANNPINNYDPSGSIVQFIALGIVGIAAYAYSLLPTETKQAAAQATGEALSAVYNGGKWLITTSINGYKTAGTAIANAVKSKTTTATTTATTTKTQTKTNDPKDVVIYRYGGTNPGNLTPTLRDVSTNTGLSFSTIPKPGAAKTTINTVNSTGILYAVKDGAFHVSIYPTGSTIKGWYNAGSSSIWTQTLKSIVIKWDGVN